MTELGGASRAGPRAWLAIGLASAVALACGAAAPAAPSPALGSPPHVLIGNAASFVPGGVGTPLCPSAAQGQIVCYSPSFIRQAYDFPSGPDAPTGAGQTIVIVEAYGSPTIAADLASFDGAFSIPAPPSFTIVSATGTGAEGSGDLSSWAFETSLDVEYAHASAPGAAIVLAVAATDDISDLVAAEQQVLPRYPGAIVTQSFGDDETDFGSFGAFRAFHRVFVAATRAGGTLLAGAGDFGATDGNNYVVAAYPASDPLVIAVGGTEGLPYPDGLWVSPGSYGGEQVWNEGDVYDLATGGAPSILFRAPLWQRGLSGFRTRTVPDVSFDAAIDGGVVVYDGGDVFTGGGTSAGVPQWAGIIALANELRARAHRRPLGFATDDLYRLASSARTYAQDFHDITQGDNRLDSTKGFSAGAGYDLASGLGTPDVANLISDLASAPLGIPDLDEPDQSVGGFPFGLGGLGLPLPHLMIPGL
jgi:subtilase family serine protease